MGSTHEYAYRLAVVGISATSLLTQRNSSFCDYPANDPLLPPGPTLQAHRQGLSAAPHRLMNRGVGRAAAMGAVVDLDGIALMPVLLLTGAPLIASAQPMMVGIYMALVPMLLGYLLFGYGLTRVTPSAATTLTLAEPAIAALLAVVLVGERLPAIGWAGLAGICASLLVISLAPATHACAAEPSRSRELPIRQEA